MSIDAAIEMKDSELKLDNKYKLHFGDKTADAVYVGHVGDYHTFAYEEVKNSGTVFTAEFMAAPHGYDTFFRNGEGIAPNAKGKNPNCYLRILTYTPNTDSQSSGRWGRVRLRLLKLIKEAKS